MGIRSTLSFIARHPSSRGWRFIANFARLIYWQIRCRITSRPMAFAFTNGSRLLAARGLHGVTGNLYVGLHEYSEMSFALSVLKPGDLFVDVGANVGSYSILAASCGASVIAFEPDKKSYAWLRRNIELNSYESLVDARCLGVSNQTGIVPFITGEDTTNRISGCGDTNISVTTLDEALAGNQCPVLIKADVEGHETEVLEGAKHILANSRLKFLIIEGDATIDLLRRSGFVVIQRCPGNTIFARANLG
jgi:FkbM family methyltransferase